MLRGVPRADLRYHRAVAENVRPPVAIRIVRPYESEDELLEHELETVGKTSVVLIGAHPRPTGVILRFEVTLASGTTVLRGEGRVLAHKENAFRGQPGLTLRFTRLDPRSKALVDRATAMRERALAWRRLAQSQSLRDRSPVMSPHVESPVADALTASTPAPGTAATTRRAGPRVRRDAAPLAEPRRPSRALARARARRRTRPRAPTRSEPAAADRWGSRRRRCPSSDRVRRTSVAADPGDRADVIPPAETRRASPRAHARVTLALAAPARLASSRPLRSPLQRRPPRASAVVRRSRIAPRATEPACRSRRRCSRACVERAGKPRAGARRRDPVRAPLSASRVADVRLKGELPAPHRTRASRRAAVRVLLACTRATRDTLARGWIRLSSSPVTVSTGTSCSARWHTAAWPRCGSPVSAAERASSAWSS